MKLLQSNSGHYYYSEGRGNPIVFLHGFPDCPENYKDQLSFFASKGYQALVPYMPGYHPEDKDLDTYQSVQLVGVEAGGYGLESGVHAARFSGGKVGVAQGYKTYFFQNKRRKLLQRAASNEMAAVELLYPLNQSHRRAIQHQTDNLYQFLLHSAFRPEA